MNPIRPLWHASRRSPFELPRAKVTHTARDGANRLVNTEFRVSAQHVGRSGLQLGVTLRIRPDLDNLPAYVPGKTFPGAIKLASNEVTDGPLPSVVEAIADAAASVNRYPDNAIVELTATLAKKLGVTEDEVQVGCGSVILCQNLILVT